MSIDTNGRDSFHFSGDSWIVVQKKKEKTAPMSAHLRHCLLTVFTVLWIVCSLLSISGASHRDSNERPSLDSNLPRIITPNASTVVPWREELVVEWEGDVDPAAQFNVFGRSAGLYIDEGLGSAPRGQRSISKVMYKPERARRGGKVKVFVCKGLLRSEGNCYPKSDFIMESEEFYLGFGSSGGSRVATTTTGTGYMSSTLSIAVLCSMLAMAVPMLSLTLL